MVKSDVIPRKKLNLELRAMLGRSRVVALIVPRQCGKTTLARQVAEVPAEHYFDLEDPVSLARLEAPRTALDGLTGIIVIFGLRKLAQNWTCSSLKWQTDWR
jgi:uncharacterized protein